MNWSYRPSSYVIKRYSRAEYHKAVLSGKVFKARVMVNIKSVRIIKTPVALNFSSMK